jgi:glycosyltransferase involved in cell wall biosynthesis
MASRSLEPALLNLYSAICADRIVFNSEFNRSTFFQGAELFLAKMPDHVPHGIVGRLAAKTTVLPVPIEEHCYVSGEQDSQLTLLWNHRWEYDKGPGRLLDICRRLVSQGVVFKLNLLGQAFRETPAEIRELISLLSPGDYLAQVGFIEKESDYRQCLASSNLVLSTALHEFQGLSVLEGMAAGCYPVVPDRLCYPEFIDEEYRYPCGDATSDGDEYEAEINAAVELILHLHRHPPRKSSTGIDSLSWDCLVGQYQGLIKDVSDVGISK